MGKMESVTILVIGLLFFAFNLKAQNKSNKRKDLSNDKSKLSGKEIVVELSKLNFFNLTDKLDLKTTKAEFEKSYNELSFFEGIMKDDLIFTDNRFYFIDSEALFEGGGLIHYLETVKVSFDKLNLKLVFSDEYNDQTEKHWKHTVRLNGKEYIAYDNDFGNNDWGISYINFIEMLNGELKLQQSAEQFYPITSGNDGKMVLLTNQQFEFVKANYPNDNEHPKKISDWKNAYGF
ncbi:hypothetical protein [Flavobacterium aquidurense]|jgi:hypothetical protein|uniref:hypothetical protein n=1 Tax=Flavobacterium aquidurense TaxID=362413 RepID=UPI0009241697|nr:hypothetical protein [Flavobacterium aquidurense]SHG58715.1 hypothetical protein SAMN05444481_105219 [Flavobacterium frigidimaris]